MDMTRAARWQEAWAREQLAVARRKEGVPKFYALVAYPGPSGFLHVGHFLGLVYADILHRYHRMLGEQVFFPTGVHASGLPAVVFATKVRDGDPIVRQALDERGVSAEERARISDPAAAARFLGAQYLEDFRAMGILVDPTAYLTTIDDDYRAFIRWQFHRLRDRGGLVQKTYFAPVCPVCGPVAVDASETDLSAGGGAEVVLYTAVPFTLDDGRCLLAATLRPETVYGVTNLWVHPTEPLRTWTLGSQRYLVGEAAVPRLIEQHGGELGPPVAVSEIVGQTAKGPLTDPKVPILASRVVDPRIGTGVVMSVPAHAPADALALRELAPELRGSVPPILEVLEIPEDAPLSASERALRAAEGVPAERALRATGARSLDDRGPLAEATERLYRLELVRGRMTVGAGKGRPVREVREAVGAQLISGLGGLEFRQFSEPVVCRNGHAVVIRRIPDQWFLAYGDAGWKAEVRNRMPRLRVQPDDYAREVPEVVEWLDDRPCIRRGRWLGTPFPFAPEWTIEPIADSTFYPAYFIVRRFVHAGRLSATQLTDALFDFVILGEGPGEPGVEPSLQRELRAEFEYWYPLDWNIGGKEHKRVHFPVFLFTHAKLLPPGKFPLGVFVHGWVTNPAGAKLSKKDIGTKGGAVPPLAWALREWGADTLRLLYTLGSSPSQDREWDPDLVETVRGRLAEVERLVRWTRGDGPGAPELEAWLESEIARQVIGGREALDRLDLRGYAEFVYVSIPATLRRFVVRGGAPSSTTRRLGDLWVRLLSPVTPYRAEELGEGRFPTLVAQAPFPDPAELTRSPRAEAAEGFLARVEEDLREVLRPLEERGEPVPSEVIFYIAADWKRVIDPWLRAAGPAGAAPSPKEILERLAREVPELSVPKAELAQYVVRARSLVRTDPGAPESLHEEGVLRAAEGYLVRRFGFRQVSVHREETAAPHDPLRRRERARPGRPAFYLVRGAGSSGTDARRA
ncbi:MAG: class I tRNA ligase family protein [Thermoplasmata archaeon]